MFRLKFRRSAPSRGRFNLPIADARLEARLRESGRPVEHAAVLLAVSLLLSSLITHLHLQIRRNVAITIPPPLQRRERRNASPRAPRQRSCAPIAQAETVFLPSVRLLGTNLGQKMSAGRQASASLQYCTHFASSAITVEPSGTGYSNSMQAGKPYFSFFINCKISLICVSPCPQGIFGP